MNDNTHKPTSIVIVGGGTAGWMAASLLQQHWAYCRISLIESQDIATIGVGEGSTPYMRHFFKQLAIPESEWMPACSASYKCGISFPNWSTKEGFESYFHPFYSNFDLKTGEAFFHNVGLRRRGSDVPAHPDDFWLASELARTQRAPITRDKMPFEPDYAYHFDSGLLGDFLKRRAIDRGIVHIVDTVEHIEQRSDGGIKALMTQSGGKLSAELFLDCSGFAALLINKTLKTPFQSYQHSLFNDRAVAIASPLDNSQAMPSETVSAALSCGWAWKIPLTTRYGNGYVYSSKYLTEEQAEQELRGHIGAGAQGMEARHLKMRVGRSEQHWVKNTLAVGLSQGFIEPLEATALMLVQYTVERFIKDYAGPDTPAQVLSEFNGAINNNFDGIRDYIIAHYKLNSRSDSAYWIDNRNNPIHSERLQTIFDSWDKGEDFEATLSQYKGEISYLRPSWYCILAGMGRFPSALRPPSASTQVAPADQARRYCQNTAERFHDHRAYLLSTYGEQWPRGSGSN